SCRCSFIAPGSPCSSCIRIAPTSSACWRAPSRATARSCCSGAAVSPASTTTEMALRADDILGLLEEDERASLEALEAFESIESTNTWLLWQPAPAAGRFRAAIADYQTHGRGRRGRRWIAPPGAAICLSLAGTFEQSPGNLPSLTLAMGVGVASALRTLGAADIRLKWPNDLVARDG